jgi:hypothetical protein
MPNRILFTVFFALVMTMASPAQTVSAPSSPKPSSQPTNSTEMKQIFLQDQYDRGNNPYAKPGEPEPKELPGAEVRRNDDAREARVKELIKKGLLHTGTDYYRAALIFQHSGNAEGTLLAHILSEIALSKGKSSALWMSAATLDRYLVQIKQKQIFGTQFKSLDRRDETRPYLFVPNDIEPDVIDDSLRAEFCVKPFAKQGQAIPASSIDSGLTPCPADEDMQKRSKSAGIHTH